MKWLLQKLVTVLFGERHAHTMQIAGNAAWLFVMHCFALGAGFIANYLMVNFAGVDNLGAYVYLFNLLYLLCTFCNFGVDTLVLTQASVYHSAKTGGKLKGLFLFSLIIVLVTTLLVSVSTTLLFSPGVITANLSDNWFPLSVSVLLLLLITTISQSGLQSLGKVVQSQFIEKVLKPVLLITLLVILYGTSGMLSKEKLVIANIVVITAGAITALWLSMRKLVPAWQGASPVFETTAWLRSSAGFYLVAVLYMLNARTDIFMLGLFQPHSSVGIYSISLRMSELIGFALMIINFVLAPLTVQLIQHGETKQLQRIITSSARAVVAVGLPLLLAIVVFRSFLLGIFGREFIVAAPALLILCAGQLVNILIGPVELILVMTGNQKYSVISLAAGTGVNIILNLMLTPVYGITGTAIASAASLLTWKSVMYIFVRKNTDLRTTAWGRF